MGLADPITSSEITAEERLKDGLPQALDESIRFYGLRYFKVKINATHDRDLDRLGRIAHLFHEYCKDGYVVSLDGNEQYRDLSQVERLLEALRSQPHGPEFCNNVSYIEQPLSRDLALDTEFASAVRRLSEIKPVIIDESDDLPDSFERAAALGYRGTSHKNCKGIFKSLKNRALIHQLNSDAGEQRYFLTAEDLVTTAVIPLQQDLTSLASLGIKHAERNGHHYFHGLDHLPETEARSALKAHPDLYREAEGRVFLKIEDGYINCSSLQCAGYGCASEISFEERVPLEEWNLDQIED